MTAALAVPSQRGHLHNQRCLHQHIVRLQILRGDGSDSYYRSKVFLGTDGAPITFTVSPFAVIVHVAQIHSGATLACTCADTRKPS